MRDKRIISALLKHLLCHPLWVIYTLMRNSYGKKKWMGPYYVVAWLWKHSNLKGHILIKNSTIYAELNYSFHRHQLLVMILQTKTTSSATWKYKAKRLQKTKRDIKYSKENVVKKGVIHTVITHSPHPKAEIESTCKSHHK